MELTIAADGLGAGVQVCPAAVLRFASTTGREVGAVTASWLTPGGRLVAEGWVAGRHAEAVRHRLRRHPSCTLVLADASTVAAFALGVETPPRDGLHVVAALEG